MSWRLVVVYPSSRFPQGDDAVEKAVGSGRGDSGCGFGERDMEFLFNTELEALAAKKHVEDACPFVTHVEVCR